MHHNNITAEVWAFIAKTPLQSRKSLATLTGVMCSTSQCELRSTFPNLRETNVIRIVTYYTLPPLESPDSSWMTRSQRSRRRDKGLLYSMGTLAVDVSQLVALHVFHIRPAARIPLGHDGSLWPLCLLQYVLFALCRTSSIASAVHDARWSKLRIVLFFDIAC